MRKPETIYMGKNAHVPIRRIKDIPVLEKSNPHKTAECLSHLIPVECLR